MRISNEEGVRRLPKDERRLFDRERAAYLARRSKLMQILIAIGVHGPEGVFLHLAEVRRMRRQEPDSFQQVVWALRAQGVPREEIMDVLIGDGPHHRDCACRRCLTRFHVAVWRWASALAEDRREHNPGQIEHAASDE